MLDGKQFSFTSEESRKRVQNSSLLIVLKSDGQFGASDDYWTQNGIGNGHSVPLADCNWSPAHILLNVTVFNFSVFSSNL